MRPKRRQLDLRRPTSFDVPCIDDSEVDLYSEAGSKADAADPWDSSSPAVDEVAPAEGVWCGCSDPEFPPGFVLARAVATAKTMPVCSCTAVGRWGRWPPPQEEAW